MKTFLLSLLFLGFAFTASAQKLHNGEGVGQFAKNIDVKRLNTGFFRTKADNGEYETKGTEYLYPEWRRGVIVVNRIKEPFSHNSIKVDLMHDLLEFNLGDDGLKVMDAPAFDTLYLENPEGAMQTFVRAEKLHLPGQFKGICEVLYDGKFQIVKTYYSKVLPADYNMALMVGRKYDELVVRSDLYVIEGGKTYELPKKKDEVLDLLSKYFPTARQDYKKNKPQLKDEVSLLAFIKLNLEPQH